MKKINLTDAVAAGCRNLGEFYELCEDDETMLCAHDHDRQESMAIAAERLADEDADGIYARAVEEAKAHCLSYPADRDRDRFSVWRLATDKDGYRLYIILDSEADNLFFMDGPSSSALYTDFAEDVLVNFFGVITGEHKTQELAWIVDGRPATVRSAGDSMLAADVEDDGMLCIRVITDNRVDEAVGDVIEREIRDLPLRLVRDDNSANIAWYTVAD